MRLLLASLAMAIVLPAAAQTGKISSKPDKPLTKSPDISQLSDYLSDHTLTIDQAVRVALATNRPLAQAKANLFTQQGRTSEAFAALNPTLYGALSTIRLNDSVVNKQITNIDPTNLNNPIGAEVVTSNVQQQLAGVTANLPVDISGTLHAATAQAKYQELAYKMDVARTQNQIVSDVKSAFYDVLRAQALVKVAAEDLKNSQDRLKDAQDRYTARVVTKFDVLRAQTDVAAAQQNLIVARNTVKTDAAILNEIIGIKVDTPLNVTDSGAVFQPPAMAVTTPETDGNLGPEFQADLSEALKGRPEISEANAFIDAAKKGITVARRSDMPSFNLSWSYLYAPNAGGSNPLVHTWQAQALLSIPIFDGGFAKARVQEARGALANAQISERSAVDQVTLEAEQAYLAVNEAQQRVDVANQTLDEAKEAFNLAQVRYKAGVSARAGISPLLELSDAQTALTQAETNQVNALYDYNSSVSRLNRALGRYAGPLTTK